MLTEECSTLPWEEVITDDIFEKEVAGEVVDEVQASNNANEAQGETTGDVEAQGNMEEAPGPGDVEKAPSEVEENPDEVQVATPLLFSQWPWDNRYTCHLVKHLPGVSFELCKLYQTCSVVLFLDTRYEYNYCSI